MCHGVKFLTTYKGKICQTCAKKTRMRIILCPDCLEQRTICAKGRCVSCYYRFLNGYRQRSPLLVSFRKPRYIFCGICLTQFRRLNPNENRFGAKYCSLSCGSIYRRLKSGMGTMITCVRCKRVRPMRSRFMCASCYAMVRLDLSGIGACPIRMNVLNRPNSNVEALA